MLDCLSLGYASYLNDHSTLAHTMIGVGSTPPQYCSEWLVTSSGVHRTGIGNPFRLASFGTENGSCFPVVEYRGSRSVVAWLR